MAIQLAYQAAPGPTSPVRRPRPAPRHRVLHGRRGPRFGVIGAGRFATATLIPGLLGTGLEPVAIASARGLSAEGARRRFGFSAAHASAEELLYRDDLDLIVIATRHDSHAELTSRALERGVPVYVEKPLALSSAELQRVGDAQRAADTPLFVGFNRRHAPLAERIRELPDPRLMVFRVNAGRLGRGHWLNDLARGGGRLLGEGCHFVDFLCDQAPADPLSVAAGGFPSDPELPIAATDNFQLQIRFADGSSGTVHYSADAPAGPGKERFETSAPGAYAVIEDFRRGAVWEGGRRRKLGSRRQDKGFAAQFASVAAVLRGEADPPDADSYVLSTLTTLAAVRSLQSGEPERVMIAEPDSPLEEEAAAVLG